MIRPHLASTATVSRRNLNCCTKRPNKLKKNIIIRQQKCDNYSRSAYLWSISTGRWRAHTRCANNMLQIGICTGCVCQHVAGRVHVGQGAHSFRCWHSRKILGFRSSFGFERLVFRIIWIWVGFLRMLSDCFWRFLVKRCHAQSEFAVSWRSWVFKNT